MCIIKTVKDNKNSVINVSVMNINDNLPNNQLTIANAINKYFPSVTDNIIINNYTNQVNFVSNNIKPFTSCAFKQQFLNIKLKHTSTTTATATAPTATKEIQVIVKSLKTKNSHAYDEISTKI